MITILYSIYDSKAGIYNKPFYLLNNAVAMRTAIDLLSDPNTDVGRHPEDFTLFKIGTYDDNTGQVAQLSTLEPVIRFHELAALQNQDS